jgi:NAD(P)-dependent dehydrogenase (short-subunit alcohol dehydrogenase family)
LHPFSGELHRGADAGVYAGSKSALAALSRDLRRSVARYGVRLVEASSPSVATETTPRRGEGSETSPEAVARSIAEGLASDRTRTAPRVAHFAPRLAGGHES